MNTLLLKLVASGLIPALLLAAAIGDKHDHIHEDVFVPTITVDLTVVSDTGSASYI